MADDFEDTSVPSGLSQQDEICLRIGYLAINCGQAEAWFRGMFMCLTGPANGHTATIWLNTKSTSMRVKMLVALAKSSGLSEELKSGIIRAQKDFVAISNSRNTYCHAEAEVDGATGSLLFLRTAKTTNDGDGFKEVEISPQDAISELIAAQISVMRLLRGLLPLLEAVREATGSHWLELPEAHPQYRLKQYLPE